MARDVRTSPYGSWRSPVTADAIVAGVIGLSQIQLDGDDIYWVEQRPAEAGRNVVVRRRPGGVIDDITPAGFNARTRVHEYGGGAYLVKQGTVWFSNFADQRLYRQPNITRDEEQPVKPVTYSVIKHGLIGLTKYLATYWADQGVRVNAISPGGVFNNQDPAFVERLTRLIPMGRMARVDEYCAAVQFLCSDASSYMTGQNMVMDGGRSVW